MQRQVWIFLEESDEEELLARLNRTGALRRLPGRFLKGTVEDVLQRPEEIETAQLTSTEKWVHLVHPEVTRSVVLHPVTEGPFAGWSRLDEVRSEVVTLVRAAKDATGLPPSQLRTSTHAWFGAEKLRKGPAFTQWATEIMRIAEEYPRTAFDWLRVAPGAETWARQGGVLHYLFRPIALLPAEGATEIYRPHASLARK